MSYTVDPADNVLKILEENHYYPFGKIYRSQVRQLDMKKSFLKIIRQNLSDNHFVEFDGRFDGAKVLFVKGVREDFFLSIGITYSNLIPYHFTCDFYLSQTTRWSALWGDMPHESYERPGKFLNVAERTQYLNDNFATKGIIDVWWDGKKEEEVHNFNKVLDITIPRFLNQTELYSKIRESNEISILRNLAQKVIFKVKNNFVDSESSYEGQKLIPSIWYSVAEYILQTEKMVVNKDTICDLAIDAYRQYVVNSCISII